MALTFTTPVRPLKTWDELKSMAASGSSGVSKKAQAKLARATIAGPQKAVAS